MRGDWMKSFERYMQACVEAQQFSGAVLLACAGEPIFCAAYGMADIERAIANSPSTKFRLASLTKQFTAMAILLLQESKRLNVEDQVSKHLSNAPRHWRDVTIEHLLRNTSGLTDFTGLPDFEQFRKFERRTAEDTIASFKDKPLEFAPGEKFAYSNSGYNLLGVIIENVSGLAYDEFLKARIFEPLAMKDSGMDNFKSPAANRALGYIRTSEALKYNEVDDRGWPYSSGGLYSTVSDMLAWEKALQNASLVPKAQMKAMFTPGLGGYGYGWFINRARGRKVIMHAGGIEGFTTHMERIPAKKLCAVVLSNIEAFSVDVIAGDLSAIALGEPYALPKVRRPIAVDMTNCRRYLGRYQLAPELIVTVSAEGDKLFVQVSGQSKFDLYPATESEFFTIALDCQITFHENARKKVTHLIIHQHQKQFKAGRLKE